MVLNYIEHSLIHFMFLLLYSRSAVGLKILSITAGIKKRGKGMIKLYF